jgi:tetratricopeptide (TPR) repeat protein
MQAETDQSVLTDLIRHSYLYEVRGEYHEAIDNISAAIHYSVHHGHSRYGELLNRKGEILQQLELYHAAAMCYLSALDNSETEEDTAISLVNCADISILLCEIPKAENRLKKALRYCPEDSYALGLAHLVKGWLEYTSVILEQEPEIRGKGIESGIEFMLNAEKILTQLLDANPKDLRICRAMIRTSFRLGCLYEQLNNTERAQHYSINASIIEARVFDIAADSFLNT